MRSRLAEVTLIAALLAGCRSRAPADESPGDGTQASSPSSGDEGSEAAREAVTHGSTHDEGSSGEGSELPLQSIDPQHLATRMRSALSTGDRLGVQEVLHELGRNLSVWRRRPDPTLAAAVVQFASWEHRGLRSRIDGRYVVPAAEFLLEQRDYAAILRLTTEYAASPAASALAGLRELAEAESAHAPARLRVEGCEGAMLDDRRVGPLTTPVPSGSWTLRCPADDSQRALLLEPSEDLLVRWPAPGEQLIRIPLRQP